MGSYPELLCLKSFYIKKAGSAFLSMFFYVQPVVLGSINAGMVVC